MKIRYRTCTILLVVLLLLVLGGPAAAPFAAPREPTIKDLGTLDGYPSAALALNDRGQVVGTAVVASDEIRPFLWESGRMIDLGPGNLAALDINDRGQILLQQFLAHPDDSNSCFLRDGETMIDLGHLDGGARCFASDLNNRGQVVGAIGAAISGPPVVGGTWTRAFLWQSGTMTDLGSLGGDYAYAVQINDRGQIVGGSTASFGGPEHAFLWESGVMTDLGAPGADWSRAMAINNRGQVALMSGDHIYLWEAGSTTDLGTLGGVSAQPLDINDRGQILVVVSDGFPSPARSVIWEAGNLIPLSTAGSGTAYASCLNNRGQAAGVEVSDSGPDHAVLWTRSDSR